MLNHLLQMPQVIQRNDLYVNTLRRTHFGEYVVELREGFRHTFLIVYDDRAVGSERRHLQGHDHAVVMV